VEIFTLHQNGKKKYPTKRSDATPKERHAFRPPANQRNGLQQLSLQLRRAADLKGHRISHPNPRNIHTFGALNIVACDVLRCIAENGRKGSVSTVTSYPWNARTFDAYVQNTHALGVYKSKLGCLSRGCVGVMSYSAMAKLLRHGSINARDWPSRKIAA
jgi:hypothetical protein